MTNGSTNMRIPRVNNIILFYIGGIAGSFIIFYIAGIISKLMTKNMLYNALIVMGQNTSTILATNRIIQIFLIAPVIDMIFGFIIIPYETVISRTLIFCMEMIFFYPVIKLVNKWIPFSIGK